MEWVFIAAAALVAAVIATLVARNTALREEIARQRDALGETKDLLEKTDQKLRDTFQSLASAALKDNREAFFDLAKTSFDSYKKPIEDTLKKVDVRLESVERERVDTYARLTEKVVALASTTEKLSRALRTPAVRGRWGEMQLRKVVELTGMLERCDFDEQPTLYGDNGRMRPDLIVHLPGRKQIVIDVKTPLEAYLDAQEAPDEETRGSKLDAHARQVRDHMEKLASKSYWEPLDHSPEMVVLFLPGEMLFSAALQRDPGLIESGLQRRVLLASPTTLIALLTTVAHTWRQEALAENYREVAQLGRDFYERLARFADHFNELRKKLDGAVHAYNEAVGSFESRVLVSARRLKELKVTTAEDLPDPEPIDTVPRVMKQIGLMGLPDDAVEKEPDLT
jgi:DNA recombination protein RmuC